MQSERSISKSPSRALPSPTRRQVVVGLTVILIAIFLGVAFKTPFSFRALSSTSDLTANDLDQRIQRAATLALGDRRGTIIVIDPQTGRIRAVVNPEIGFGKAFPVGSAVKPFTALAALDSGVIAEDSRTLCHEKYSHHAFQTTCSHPRELPPLNPTEALAYSCNYYFSSVGERLNEEAFSSTLSEFGFGKKTGVNTESEESGALKRSEWRPQNAIGEGAYFQATPLQVIVAYSALLNGGHLFTPRLTKADGFVASSRASLSIKESDRDLIVKGMRGAVRYGSAEKANLYSLPIYVFGKTGTSTELEGFRTHGWFVGFASQPTTNSNADAAARNLKLAVLVFLNKGHGFEAAEVSRAVFTEFARSATAETNEASTNKVAVGPETQPPADSRRSTATPPSIVRVHLVRENVTREVGFEDYIRGVVAAEGSMETEPEALKALALTVRTYALKNLDRHTREGYDFCTSTHCQRYREVDSASASYVSPATIKAVTETSGEILVDGQSETADAYFSASCGGATANLTTLWGGNAPIYLRGVRDDYCTSEAHHSWTDVISHTQLAKALQSDPRTNVGERLGNISVTRIDASGRAELITIEGNRRVIVNGWDFKIIVGRVLGWNLLKSSRFSIGRSGSNFVFRGSGFGHGLGLCQEGAHVMAERGSTYRQIIARYFPSVRIGRANGNSSFADDLMWSLPNAAHKSLSPGSSAGLAQRSRRATLRSEHFRLTYPTTVAQRDIEGLLQLLESSRSSLLSRVTSAGINAQLPVLEVFVNDSTGNFVGRTGQPPWAAAATRGTRIELQPLATLKQRGILETTLRHELVHTVVDILGRGRAPRWLAEGLALHVAGEGALVARYEPRPSLTSSEIENRLSNSKFNQSANDMRATYAAAYAEVKRLIEREGEASVWRKVARSG